MPLKKVEPEKFYVHPTPHVPNSKLPILVYRDVLQDTSPETILSTIEPNGWLKGGQFKTYPVPHFHCLAHECYGIIKGSSTYLLGKSPLDPETDEHGKSNGIILHVKVGDVFVLPAGVSHCSIESAGDYEFIGLYPEAPLIGEHRYDMNWGKDPPEETPKLAEKAATTPIPELDPLYGLGGPLPKLWNEA
ncbi:hypothetical protein EV356DRAFT_473031 [Viridothelium virens]|uniref:Uncharacterized protein n=1 Tax=Viridothelium virens TaxID=1048519 RepID=A0A6A6GY51_VIRVR|nr:hypothetical protein EV356DRAFT_473031 [Viridothelium virens]